MHDPGRIRPMEVDGRVIYTRQGKRQLFVRTLILAAAAAVIFWAYDSFVDFLLFDVEWEEAWLPEDAMESWMRLFLVLFVASFVFYSRYSSYVHLHRFQRVDRHSRLISDAMEQAEDGVAIFNADGGIDYLNAAFMHLSGLGDSDAASLARPLLNQHGWYRALRARLALVARSGEAWRGRMELDSDNGKSIPVMATLSPVSDGDDGRSFIVTLHDLSDYERMQGRLQEFQKMEAVGVLASGMAHDFNNMLAGIQGNAFLIRQGGAAVADIAERTDKIMQLCEKSAEMIRHLLTFSGKDHVRFALVDPIELLREVHTLAAGMLSEAIELNLILPVEVEPIMADGNQLQLALINLIINARDAVEQHSNPHIELALSICREGDELLQRHGLYDDYLCMAVRDNGSGIAAEIRDRIFEPFFSTKEVGKGSGLGLAMVYGAMQRHGGVAGFDSNEQGSHFYLLLPAAINERGEAA